MARIYTTTGDDGRTSLWGSQRVLKDDTQVEAYGSVDELNSLIGLMRAEKYSSSEQTPDSQEIDELLDQIQTDLFQVGAELAATPRNREKLICINDSQVRYLESSIDQLDAELEPLKQFILPGGDRLGATCHFARTVCRRAERRVVSLASTSEAAVSLEVIKYLNRLSDLLFVLARTLNQNSGCVEKPWVPKSA